MKELILQIRMHNNDSIYNSLKIKYNNKHLPTKKLNFMNYFSL